jgi:hypothetical protein
MIAVQRKSIVSGEYNTMQLDVTEEQLQRHRNGELIQDVFPHLPAEEREFIMSGITPEEWEKIYGESDRL